MNKRLDEWACVYDGPSAVPDKDQVHAAVYRGMTKLETAIAYAEKVSDFFYKHGAPSTVYVVRGPTSTTKKPYEVVEACCGYTVLFGVTQPPRKSA